MFAQQQKKKNDFEEQFRTFFDIYKRIFIYDITFHNHTSAENGRYKWIKLFWMFTSSTAFHDVSSVSTNKNYSSILFFWLKYSGMNENMCYFSLTILAYLPFQIVRNGTKRIFIITRFLNSIYSGRQPLSHTATAERFFLRHVSHQQVIKCINQVFT